MTSFPNLVSFRPQKTGRFNKPNPQQGFTNLMGNKPNVQQVKANALSINQGGRQIQCFQCQQWGHKKADCPNKKKTFCSLYHYRKKLFRTKIRIKTKGRFLNNLGMSKSTMSE